MSACKITLLRRGLNGLEAWPRGLARAPRRPSAGHGVGHGGLDWPLIMHMPNPLRLEPIPYVVTPSKGRAEPRMLIIWWRPPRRRRRALPHRYRRTVVFHG